MFYAALLLNKGAILMVLFEHIGEHSPDVGT